MSDPIGRVSGSGIIDTGSNNIQNDSNRTQGNFGPNRAPNPADRNSHLSLRGATVSHNSPIPDNYKTAIEQIKQQKASNTFLHKLGRAVLWVVNLFKGVKSSSTLSSNEKLQVLRNKQPSPLPDNVENKGRPYIFGLHQYANLLGYDYKGMKVDFFYNPEKEPNKDYRQVLFPQGEPRLADIKQNPELQDCWFLSAISSTLQSQGTESIDRLFSQSKTPGNVLVRLGSNVYDVPMGRITSAGGDKFGSESAPWVVALENAMLIHLALSADNPDLKDPASLQNYKKSIDMPQRSTTDGLVALGGYKKGGPNTGYKEITLTFDNSQDGYNVISKLLSLGKPVIIGHNRVNSNKIALRDGIAPGHAVTVLEAIPNGYKILDPYGQVKTISKESIVDYTMYSIRDSNESDDKYAFARPKEVKFTEEMNDMMKNDENDF